MSSRTIMAVAVLAGCAALPATADVYYDNAQVISVSQQTERVNMPTQECHTDYPATTEAPRDRSVAGALIGGVAGGLLGAQVGRGTGRVAAAAVGAATGAIVGDRVDNRDGDAPPRPSEHCVMVDNWQTVIKGYLVTYRYDGHTYTATLPRDPGPTLAIRVAVDPAPANSVGMLEPRH